MSRDALAGRVRALLQRLADGTRDDAARDALIADVLRYQRRALPAFARVVERLGGGDDPLCWPALPTDVFRFTRVAVHDASEDVRVFRTSGTTAQARGAHHLRDLSLYDCAARTAARHMLFPDVARMPLVMLAPSAHELPDSSLSYMLDRFGEWFGAGPSVWAIAAGQIDLARLTHVLERAERDAQPLALLGTSFAFVHAEQALGSRRFALPPGSRIMQTGGFKGRSRELSPAQMLELLAARYGVEVCCIVQEYGMTELSSQLYESTLRDALRAGRPDARHFWVPGWVRASVVDPATLAPVPDGHEGLLRIDDPCNLDTACAVQTSDRARAVDGGLLVLGRAADAVPRGCSLAIDAVLGG